MKNAVPSILGYGASTSAGPHVEDLWRALATGRDGTREVSTDGWPVPARIVSHACIWRSDYPVALGSAHGILVQELERAYGEAIASLPGGALDRMREGSRFGVVLATTKGAVDDSVWDKKRSDDSFTNDLLAPLLEDFLGRASLRPVRRACVSNACASGLSALALASEWLLEGALDEVLVLAADRVGPFVLQGFSALRALSAERARPFSAERTGLRLGDGAAAIVCSNSSGPFRITGYGIDAEGFAVTRPTEAGESLTRACLRIDGLRENPPDLIVAHGTATLVNDPIEANVFAHLFPGSDSPSITGSKGAIGHTLGASGAIDAILALESIRRREIFPLTNTGEADPTLPGKFVVATGTPLSRAIRSVLVTSLGFGGIHAAMRFEAGTSDSNEESTVTSSNRTTFELPIPSEIRVTVRYPVKEAPPWSALAERWYQLDPYAFALAEAAWIWKNAGVPAPDTLLLASPGGSNATDRRFAREGSATSPSIFVHTLPNVRSSTFCQVYGWNGPLFCLQRDPHTLDDAISTVRTLMANGRAKRPWILTVTRDSLGALEVTRIAFETAGYQATSPLN